MLEAYDGGGRAASRRRCRADGQLELPDTAPVIIAEIPAPAGAPTVLLYSHYDVVPVGRRIEVEVAAVRGDRAGRRDLRLRRRGYEVERHGARRRAARVGREAARRDQGRDRRAGGESAALSTTYPPTDPELFDADAMVIGDMGSVRPGVPTLTVALRGMAIVTVEVRTLAGPEAQRPVRRRGPDALMVLPARARDAARRARRRRRARPAPREVERRVLQRGRVPGAGRDRTRGAVLRHRRAGRAALVGAGDHRDRGWTCCRWTRR